MTPAERLAAAKTAHVAAQEAMEEALKRCVRADRELLAARAVVATVQEEVEAAQDQVWLEQDRRTFPTPTGAIEGTLDRPFRRVLEYVEGRTAAGSLYFVQIERRPRREPEISRRTIRKGGCGYDITCEVFGLDPNPPQPKGEPVKPTLFPDQEKT